MKLFLAKNKFTFMTGLVNGSCRNVFRILSVEKGKRTQRPIAKREYYKEVIVTHKRNKQNSSTAENAQESGNIDYECVAGEFLGTK